VLLSIPSPGDPFIFQLGGFHPRWYSVLLAVAVVAGIWVTRSQFGRRGLDPELVFPVAVCAIVLGLVGARVEHIATDWKPYDAIPHNAYLIWHGGLGIFGAVLGGMAGTWIGCRIVRLPFLTVADCAAPGLILGQAIGRLGNYTNQELYGRASGLPWAVKIDHPVPPYLSGQTFQPTFLYELVWDLAVLAALLIFVRRTGNRARPGTVFALYALLYALGRLWIETIRIDHTDLVLGQRVEVWVAAVVAIVAGAAFAQLWRGRAAVGER
jgi:prolipoprotein diacylglyceryl transferase